MHFWRTEGQSDADGERNCILADWGWERQFYPGEYYKIQLKHDIYAQNKFNRYFGCIVTVNAAG